MFKNEWIKLFRNRVFLIFFAALFVFYGFYLYWFLVLYVKSGVVEQASVSVYQEIIKELDGLSLTDEEKLEFLTERQGQLEELTDMIDSAQSGQGQLEELTDMIDSAQSGQGQLEELAGMLDSAQLDERKRAYAEVWSEVNQAVHYQEIRSGIIGNADKQLRRLDRGNNGNLERRYLASSLEKTREVYGRLSEVVPVSGHARGLEALVDNPVADFCCLFIILLAVVELVTVERQKEQTILSKSTVRGRRVHGLVKAAVFYACMRFGRFCFTFSAGPAFILSAVSCAGSFPSFW